MRVVTGGECYYCWAKRRRDHKGLDQKTLNQRRKGCKKFKDDHDKGRAELARGRRTHSTGGDHLDESTTVHGERGVFGRQFDEGHFYHLDDFLQLHYEGRKFHSKAEKVNAVRALNKDVCKDKFSNWRVNESSLPPKAAYKYQAGDEETFKKISSDELDDADEANEHLQHLVDHSGLSAAQAQPSDGVDSDRDGSQSDSQIEPAPSSPADGGSF